MKHSSLKAFAQSKKQVKCVVCALDKKLARQIADRNRKAVSLPMVFEWLWTEHGIKITMAQYLAHSRAGHAWRAKAAR